MGHLLIINFLMNHKDRIQNLPLVSESSQSLVSFPITPVSVPYYHAIKTLNLQYKPLPNAFVCSSPSLQHMAQLLFRFQT